MKARLGLALFLTLLLPAGAMALEIGGPAPDFLAIDSNGGKHKLSDFKGKTVVLEWTNHDCPYVRRHYGTGNMQTLQKEATKDGVVWLSVISSAPGRQGHVKGPEANDLTMSRKASPTAVLLDPKGEVGRKYGARTTPHMYVVNATGTLVYQGGIDDKPYGGRNDVKSAKNFVRAALNDISQGKPVQTAVSRPYGCSVKYGW